jgi:hypothetical protein
MWFLVILTFMNAALDQKGIVLVQRISFFGLPINIMDASTAVAFVVAIFAMLSRGRRHEGVPAHPAFIAAMVLGFLALVGGSIGAAMVHAPLYAYASEVRNFASFPISMFTAYYLLKSPRSSLRFSYVHVISGVLTAALIMIFFLGKSAEEANRMAIDQVRALQYVSWYAGLAAALLMYTVLNPQGRMFPTPLAIGLICFCFVGQFGTLSRSDWLTATVTLMTIPFLVPKARRGIKLVVFAMTMPVLVICLLIGVTLASNFAGRDFSERLSRRVMTLLPGRADDEYGHAKAWDTRLPGAVRELELWLDSPVIGNGFGYTVARGLENEGLAFYHNVWSSSLAMMGVLGFGAYATPLIAMFVVGRRMVRQAVDKGSLLVGVIGVTSGVYGIVIGLCTMGVNVQPGGIAMGLLSGVVLRARALQLAQIREYQGYVDFEARGADAAFLDDGAVGHPAPEYGDAYGYGYDPAHSGPN